MKATIKKKIEKKKAEIESIDKAVEVLAKKRSEIVCYNIIPLNCHIWSWYLFRFELVLEDNILLGITYN